MPTGYSDYQRITFLSEKAALLYFEQVYQELISDLDVTQKRLIPIGAVMYVDNSITISGTGNLWVLGTLHILTE